jgi:hypothetical protein
MSQGSVTVTGLKELEKAIENLPRSVTLALRGVAWQSSRRIKDRAAQILNNETHGTGKTAASIEVIEELEKKQFIVWPRGNPDRPANLPLWLERGTKFMRPIAYMRRSADEEDDTYKRNVEQAAIDVITKQLGNK